MISFILWDALQNFIDLNWASRNDVAHSIPLSAFHFVRRLSLTVTDHCLVLLGDCQHLLVELAWPLFLASSSPQTISNNRIIWTHPAPKEVLAKEKTGPHIDRSYCEVNSQCLQLCHRSFHLAYNAIHDLGCKVRWLRTKPVSHHLSGLLRICILQPIESQCWQSHLYKLWSTQRKRL